MSETNYFQNRRQKKIYKLAKRELKLRKKRLKLENPEGYKEIMDELKREMKAQMHADEIDFQGILKRQGRSIIRDSDMVTPFKEALKKSMDEAEIRRLKKWEKKYKK
jgi:hypothetical protein